MTPTYLDTQVTVWIAAAALDRLTEVARKHVRAAAGIRISPAVLLELEYLYEIKRLLLPASDIRLKLEKEIGLEVCALAFEQVVTAALIEKWTRDPFDRLIAAHAKASGFSHLISSDQEIRDHYPRTIW